MSPIDIALRFVESLNAHDLDSMSDLMSEDHLFTDGLDMSWRGREVMREAWRGYLQWFPDYRISIEETFGNGQVVMLVGRAHGTLALGGSLPEENRWSIPAVWRAVIGGEHVNEWRVYTDNGPVNEILERWEISWMHKKGM